MLPKITGIAILVNESLAITYEEVIMPSQTSFVELVVLDKCIRDTWVISKMWVPVPAPCLCLWLGIQTNNNVVDWHAH